MQTGPLEWINDERRLVLCASNEDTRCIGSRHEDRDARCNETGPGFAGPGPSPGAAWMSAALIEVSRGSREDPARTSDDA
jgi:hypothetical protein